MDRHGLWPRDDGKCTVEKTDSPRDVHGTKNNDKKSL
jgi:ribonuclease I